MARWTGDEWRWHTDRLPTPYIQTMYVIEPAERAERKGPKVPFGFAPRDEPQAASEPPFIDWTEL